MEDLIRRLQVLRARTVREIERLDQAIAAFEDAGGRGASTVVLRGQG